MIRKRIEYRHFRTDSLFAILSLIRQSISSFLIEERAKIIQKDLLKFQDEWNNYKDKMDSVQTKMDQASKALEEAQGTRTRAWNDH